MNQFVADRGIPGVPILSTTNPHGLGCVIVAVEVMTVSLAELDFRHILLEVGDAGIDLLAIRTQPRYKGRRFLLLTVGRR